MNTYDFLSVKTVRVLNDNYVWIIIEPSTKNAIIVDPGVAEPVLNFLEERPINPIAIFLTHHHGDHCNGAAEIKARYSIPVYGKENERKTVLTEAVDEGAKIKLADFSAVFKVIAIPGHTLDHLAYYTPGFLFCGDTLFSAGCGRIFEGTPAQMYASLLKLKQLPEDTQVYCGHEYTQANLAFAKAVEPDNQDIAEYALYVEQQLAAHLPSLPSALSHEKKINPFLRCDQPALLESLRKYKGLSFTTPVEVFAFLRTWKNDFKV